MYYGDTDSSARESRGRMIRYLTNPPKFRQWIQDSLDTKVEGKMTYYDENSFPMSGPSPLMDYLNYCKKVKEDLIREAEADAISSAASAALEEETLP